MEANLVISSQLFNINKVRLFLEEIFVKSCLDRSCFNRVFLSLSEAVNNSIVHGNSLNTCKKVFIRVNFSEDALVIDVKDEGRGFFPDQVVDPTFSENLKKEHGRGIFLMRSMADKIEFLDGGSRVCIKFTFTHEY